MFLMIKVDVSYRHMLCTQNSYCFAYLHRQESTSRGWTEAGGREILWTVWAGREAVKETGQNCKAFLFWDNIQLEIS